MVGKQIRAIGKELGGACAAVRKHRHTGARRGSAARKNVSARGEKGGARVPPPTHAGRGEEE